MIQRPLWIGFRIETTGSYDALLCRDLAPLLVQLESSGLLKRWFFLRYSIGGEHLRLRLQLRSNDSTEDIRAALQAIRTDQGPHASVVDNPYGRKTHAFGEFVETVLAELLHCETAKMATVLLKARGAHSANPGHWRFLCAALVEALTRHALDPSERAALGPHWIAFARRTCERWSLPFDAVTWPPKAAAAIPRAESRFSTALDRMGASRADWLLRRLYQRGSLGRFAAMHALHLFLNQLGITISAEVAIAETLSLHWTTHDDHIGSSSPSYAQGDAL